MKRKKVLSLQIKRDGFKKKYKKWENYDFQCVDFNFYYVVEYDEKEKVITGIKNSGKINEVIKIIEGGFDVVCCESPDAILLQYVMMKRGLKLMPFVIIFTDTLKKIKDFCAWVEKKYHENPYEIFLKNPSNYWFYSSASELKYYVREGINKENLFYIPASLYCQDAILTDKKDYAKNMTIHWKDSLIKEVKGNVLACGSNSRDYETLVQAGSDLPFDIHIFSDPRCRKLKNKSSNIKIHDVVSLKKFYQILSVAKFIIIPLHKTSLVPGMSSTGLAIGFGKPVIATNFEWLHDYVIDNYNGILVKPHDADELRKAITFLHGNKREIERMSMNSLIVSHKLDEIVKKNFKEVFAKATHFTNK